MDIGRRLKSYYSKINLSPPWGSPSLGRGVRDKMLINKAILKYGYINFKLEILEYCDPNDVIKREQYYLDSLKPEYNILQVAGSSLGHKHKDEVRLAMSVSRTGSGNHFYGKSHTVETRSLMAVAKGGGGYICNGPLSEEEFKKIGKYDTYFLGKVIEIKDSINDKRTIFVWDHLQGFYKLKK